MLMAIAQKVVDMSIILFAYKSYMGLLCNGAVDYERWHLLISKGQLSPVMTCWVVVVHVDVLGCCSARGRGVLSWDGLFCTLSGKPVLVVAQPVDLHDGV